VLVGKRLSGDTGRGSIDEGLRHEHEGGTRQEEVTSAQAMGWTIEHADGHVLTRLWSMTSAMTASFPAEGPSWMRTTRPT
jgi:hypothetical protein